MVLVLDKKSEPEPELITYTLAWEQPSFNGSRQIFDFTRDTLYPNEITLITGANTINQGFSLWALIWMLMGDHTNNSQDICANLRSQVGNNSYGHISINGNSTITFDQPPQNTEFVWAFNVRDSYATLKRYQNVNGSLEIVTLYDGAIDENYWGDGVNHGNLSKYRLYFNGPHNASGQYPMRANYDYIFNELYWGKMNDDAIEQRAKDFWGL